LSVTQPGQAGGRAQAHGSKDLVAADRGGGRRREAYRRPHAARAAATAIGWCRAAGLGPGKRGHGTLQPGEPGEADADLFLRAAASRSGDWSRSWPALYTVASADADGGAPFSMARPAFAFDPTMIARAAARRRFTAWAGDCRTIRHPGRGSSLPGPVSRGRRRAGMFERSASPDRRGGSVHFVSARPGRIPPRRRASTPEASRRFWATSGAAPLPAAETGHAGVI